MAERRPKGILKPKQIKERFEYLKTERKLWEDHWQELSDYILPNRNDITVRTTPGSKRNLILLDNTALQANELLAGALHGLLTNPNSQWFELTTGDLEIDNLDEVRGWLQRTTRNMHNVINNSNFQTEVHQYYMDLTALCTGALSVEEDDEMHIRFAARHIREIYAAENNKGRIDEVHREFKWNIRQIVAEYGMGVLELSRDLKNAWGRSNNELFSIVHAVYPRDVTDKNFNNAQRFVSQNILCSANEDVELKLKYFREFPFVIARWTKASGEVYGRGPGMNALPDAKTLNKMTETTLKGAQKTVDPPLQLPDDGFIMPIQTKPAGLNFYRAGSTDRIEPIFNDARIDFGFQAMAERRTRIRESFYVDQLQLNQGPQMTATEVNQRTEERMRLLGPMLGRQQSEFLRPMIDRVFEIMSRKGLIEAAPEILIQRGKNLDVTYSSVIAKAQKQNEMQNIQRTMQAIAPLVTVDPSVLDNFDGDAGTLIMARGYGMPQEMIRDRKQVEEIRNNRAKAQQAALEQKKNQDAVDNTAKILPGVTQLEQLQKAQ